MNNIKKILIVDDEAIQRFALKTSLQSLGYLVSEAKNGLEGAARAILENPDLIITDNDMPKMKGKKMSQQLKNVISTSKIPIIGYGGFKEKEIYNLDYNYDKSQESQVLNLVEDLLG